MVDQGGIQVLGALTHQAIVVTQAQVQAMQRAMEGIQAAVRELLQGLAAALRLDQTQARELIHRLQPQYLVTTQIMTQLLAKHTHRSPPTTCHLTTTIQLGTTLLSILFPTMMATVTIFTMVITVTMSILSTSHQSIIMNQRVLQLDHIL